MPIEIHEPTEEDIMVERLAADRTILYEKVSEALKEFGNKHPGYLAIIESLRVETTTHCTTLITQELGITIQLK